MSSSADFISRFRSDPAFRQQAELDPLAALRSAGIAVPAGVSIDFMDNASRAVDYLFDRQPGGEPGVMDDALLEGVAGGLSVSSQDAALRAQQFVTNLSIALSKETDRLSHGYLVNQTS